MLLEWRTLVAEEKEKQLAALIKEENLKDAETRHFIAHSFRDGVIKTTGTDIDNLMPPISRFGGGNRAAKKQTIIEKLGQSRILCKVQNVVQIEQNLCKTGAAQAAAALFIK